MEEIKVEAFSQGDCVKCGCKVVGPSYCKGRKKTFTSSVMFGISSYVDCALKEEHLHRTCACGYEWAEWCKDHA